jgi:hypothetical protein
MQKTSIRVALKSLSPMARVIYGEYEYETIPPVIAIDLERHLYSQFIFLYEMGGLITPYFGAEFTASIEENGNEEFVSCMESLVVYDFNHQKYEVLIEILLQEDLEGWADESLEDEELMPKSIFYANKFFTEGDNMDGNLFTNIIKIMRHIAQNGTTPEFVNFNQRNVYDLDKIAEQLIDTPPRELKKSIQ